ncbi:E3 ubiquitin-protein ligase CHFR-like isoform X2 [Harmonia axyridis]|uniref:E3 ubiquitin-protein ligase CHFR-like isoform X2 n=1 Tax=Harmonia axyridis TaxID=115357 RepID=UPI001E2795C4|nr:E3 ubiquitin-protein ligase CHFR-like isoform X2 [Harmonia axyridis]
MSMSHYNYLLNLSNNDIVRISKRKFSVGRSLESDYVLNCTSISRIHFYIEQSGRRWFLHDNSTNGTLVNKILVKSEYAILHDGDLIEFVGGTICFKYSEEQMIDNNSISEQMTSTTRNTLPSVSNDQSYERGEADSQQTSSDSSFSTIESVQKKNDVELDEETPVEKSKHIEETSEEPKLECELEASELECSICQELYIKATTLNCAHTFCSSCIMRWRSQKSHCPICKKRIENASPTIILDNLVKKLVSVMDQNNREHRNKIVEERTEEIVPAPTETIAGAGRSTSPGVFYVSYAGMHNSDPPYDVDHHYAEYMLDSEEARRSRSVWTPYLTRERRAFF